VLEYLDDTLKTATDVERFVGLATLGAIPLSEKS
jgi:capsular polysaccharide biosynthesis protein